MIGLGMDIERLFELAGVSNNEILLEAVYDNMVTAMKQKFPEKLSFIDDNIKTAKKILTAPEKQTPTSDKMGWYIKVLRAYISNDIKSVSGTYNFTNMESFNHDFFHYYGYNLSPIFNTKLNNQSISELFGTFQGYIDKYKKSPKADVPVLEGDYQLTPELNGASWWFIDRAFCAAEGRSGQHCGNALGQEKTWQRILSLRTANHNVILTFILDGGKLGEMKAKANQKPSEKYHPNIMQLLLNPIVKGINGGGAAREMNFSIFDLSEQNIQLLIKHGKESFITDQITAEPREFFKAPEYIKANPIAQTALLTRNPSWLLKLQQVGLPQSISQDFNILSNILKHDGSNIQYVLPTTPRYEELCKIAVSDKYNYALKYVPENLRTLEICKIAVSNNGYVFEYVPEKLRTAEICKIAVSTNGMSLYLVPEDLRTEELCKIAVSKDGRALYDVPEKIRTEELCKIAVKQNSGALQYVPEKLRTYELCKIAVSMDPKWIKSDYISKEFKTKELFKIALSKEPAIFMNLSDDLKTNAVCKIAVSTWERAISYVPQKRITPKLCKIAVSNGTDLSSLRNIIDDFTEAEQIEICKIAVSKTPDMIWDVPYNLRDEVRRELKITDSVDYNYFRML